MGNPQSKRIWFPEPSTPDPTYSPDTGPPEPPTAWLLRSTVPGARALRDFLNQNMSMLPEEHQAQLFARMHKQFSQAVFELTVARTLQEMGAEVDVEPTNPDGSRLDFRAKFPDGTVAVEATCPVYNSSAARDLATWSPLRYIIKRRAPRGWIINARHLPLLNPHAGYGEFKRIVTRLFKAVPDAQDHGARIYLQTTDEEADRLGGAIGLELQARSQLDQPSEVMGPATAFIDNSEEVIRETLRRKSYQARRAEVPVLLAVCAPPVMSQSNLRMFDITLFGRTVAYMDGNGGQQRTGFSASGAWTRDGLQPGTPTFAGLLAFLHETFTGGSDPVLYLHPQFHGMLPGLILDLAHRRYSPERPWVIERRQYGAPVWPRINWIDPEVFSLGDEPPDTE